MPSLLIADDTPIIRSAIVCAVALEGLDFHPIAEAKNGFEAVELASRQRPDLILMDCKMPGLDGLEASARIRGDLPQTRIIFLSAYDEFAYVQRALRLGALDYLLKPVPLATLTHLLAQVCRQIRSESERVPEHATVFEPVAVEKDAVRRAMAYIRQNYARPTISLGEVSSFAHLSPSHLAHRFRYTVGIGYKQFLTEQRISAAKILLRTTTLTIDLIAEQVGYQNVTNFYRLFQRETDATPSSYRRSGPTVSPP